VASSSGTQFGTLGHRTLHLAKLPSDLKLPFADMVAASEEGLEHTHGFSTWLLRFAMMSSSDTSDRVFSGASQIISAKRASLDSKMAEKLLFVSENWNRYANKMNMEKIVHDVDSEDEVDE